MAGAARSCRGPRSTRGAARHWRGAACSAGGSAICFERAGIKPHRWRARIGVSAFDPA